MVGVNYSFKPYIHELSENDTTEKASNIKIKDEIKGAVKKTKLSRIPVTIGIINVMFQKYNSFCSFIDALFFCEWTNNEPEAKDKLSRTIKDQNKYRSFTLVNVSSNWWFFTDSISIFQSVDTTVELMFSKVERFEPSSFFNIIEELYSSNGYKKLLPVVITQIVSL